MDVTSKPKWLENYKAAQDQGDHEAKRLSAARNQPWTLMVYLASLIAIAVAIYAWA